MRLTIDFDTEAPGRIVYGFKHRIDTNVSGTLPFSTPHGLLDWLEERYLTGKDAATNRDKDLALTKCCPPDEDEWGEDTVDEETSEDEYARYLFDGLSRGGEEATASFAYDFGGPPLYAEPTWEVRLSCFFHVGEVTVYAYAKLSSKDF